ncbi:B3/B4 domain-containing protein [Pseudoalteromonas rubra]|uniref:B3/B4 tRNA-binding domain-containing protein n=1 Tax=Pseudoalteromonas rubra TaxID=43658 RepID=A0A5S3WXV3_9GAMM|nr:phenylalanine--tRNA ligase beta subunit-related protein [Pseudoalteromonas rubra]TMP34746.1 hypothetical protein CWB98_17265 [Pseudoalteromonas rubra]
MSYKLHLDSKIKESYKGYSMTVLYVSGIEKNENFNSLEILREEESDLRERFANKTFTDEKNVVDWRATFKTFGVKHRSAVSSFEALSQRVLKGLDLPDINHVVNIYNAISIKYSLPIGGEDRDALLSDLVFTKSTGEELFIVGEGEGAQTSPKEGEPIWLDSAGATCRRWNWRQCTRTQLTENTKNAYFVLDKLPSYPQSELEKAKTELIELLKSYSPNITIEEELLEF